MERVRSVHNRIRDQALVEGGKLSTVCARERQQIAIRHLRGIQKPATIHARWIKKRNVVGPKIVARQRYTTLSAVLQPPQVYRENSDNGRDRQFAEHRFP